MKFMKMLLAMILTLGLSQTVFAEDRADADLKQNMKDIAVKFTTLAKNYTDSTKLELVVTTSAELKVILSKVLFQAAPKIATLPAADQPAAFLKYQKYNTQLLTAVIDFEDVLRQGQVAKAKEQLTLMAKLRDEAHAIFK